MNMIIKSVIWQIATLLNHIFLLKKGITCKGKCLFLLLSVRSSPRNNFCFSNATIKNTNITTIGEDNKISITGKMRNCKLKIYGNANSIITEHANINNTTIIVRGNNCKIEISSNSSIGGSYIVCMGKNKSIHIGKECMLANDIEIWNTDSHPIFSNNDLSKSINPSKSIFIDNHVWIGKKAIVLKGVTIGKNSIVGMAAVVTSSIPPSCIAAGNPARIIRDNIYWERKFINL